MSGQLQKTDYMDNTGGTNLSDSVFKIQPNQAAGGLNFDYQLTGGIQKRFGPVKINSSADTQLNTLGFGLYAPSSGASKSVLRAAGTKLQFFDTSVPSFTNLTEDTLAAGSIPFVAGSTQTVAFNQFNNGISNINWATGGGTTLPIGAYSTSKYTTNGVPVPAGAITATPSAAGTGSWTAAGAYWYGVVYRKRSTQAFSNASLDVQATTSNTTDIVTVDLTGLTSLDTTKMDQIWLYRSARSGVTGFTTGNVIAELSSSATSFVDKGDLGNPDVLTAQNVPRSGNIVLDNSVLTAGTYNACTLFKRRLVTARNSTIELSEVNKSESWPATNPIVVPSAGNITGLAVISFTSPQAQTLDELLVVFKEREVWVITGNDYTDWSLKFIDQVGCPSQSLLVTANGFLAWIDFRGIYLWDGTSKPIYCSRTMEPLFAYGGDLDKTKLVRGVGKFFRRENKIIWFLSSLTYGEQKFALKMDLRLTLPQIQQNLTGRVVDAVLIQDSYAMPTYAAMSYIPSGGANEQMVVGDASGYCYFSANGYGDGSSGINYSYKTAPLTAGNADTNKLFHKVVVWVQDIGNWNLTLRYWTNFKTASDFGTSQSLPVSTENQSESLWDIATWDLSSWDDYSPTVVPLIFNLQPGTANTNQGTALQLEFSNSNANEPILIHGFTVFWSEMDQITA